MTRKGVIITATASAVFLLDRLTKVLVGRILAPGDSMPVLGGFFDLTHVHNRGAAFGIFSFADDSFRTPFLVLSAAAAIAVLVYFIMKTRPQDTLMLFALALIIGGAAGNLVDRLYYGYVIDFIDWYVGRYHWPAFNIADSGITAGILLMGIEVLVRGKTAGGEKRRTEG